MMKESNMRKDGRALEEKANLCVLGKYDDLFNYPIPKLYITSYIKIYLILRVVNCLHNGMPSKPMKSYALISHGNII